MDISQFRSIVNDLLSHGAESKEAQSKLDQLIDYDFKSYLIFLLQIVTDRQEKPIIIHLCLVLIKNSFKITYSQTLGLIRSKWHSESFDDISKNYKEKLVDLILSPDETTRNLSSACVAHIFRVEGSRWNNLFGIIVDILEKNRYNIYPVDGCLKFLNETLDLFNNEIFDIQKALIHCFTFLYNVCIVVLNENIYLYSSKVCASMFIFKYISLIPSEKIHFSLFKDDTLINGYLDVVSIVSSGASLELYTITYDTITEMYAKFFSYKNHENKDIYIQRFFDYIRNGMLHHVDEFKIVSINAWTKICQIEIERQKNDKKFISIAKLFAEPILCALKQAMMNFNSLECTVPEEPVLPDHVIKAVYYMSLIMENCVYVNYCIIMNTFYHLSINTTQAKDLSQVLYELFEMLCISMTNESKDDRKNRDAKSMYYRSKVNDLIMLSQCNVPMIEYYSIKLILVLLKKYQSDNDYMPIFTDIDLLIKYSLNILKRAFENQLSTMIIKTILRMIRTIISLFPVVFEQMYIQLYEFLLNIFRVYPPSISTYIRKIYLTIEEIIRKTRNTEILNKIYGDFIDKIRNSNESNIYLFADYDIIIELFKREEFQINSDKLVMFFFLLSRSDLHRTNAFRCVDTIIAKLYKANKFNGTLTKEVFQNKYLDEYVSFIQIGLESQISHYVRQCAESFGNLCNVIDNHTLMYKYINVTDIIFNIIRNGANESNCLVYNSLVDCVGDMLRILDFSHYQVFEMTLSIISRHMTILNNLLSCLSSEQDKYVFNEILPGIFNIAKNLFLYLPDELLLSNEFIDFTKKLIRDHVKKIWVSQIYDDESLTMTLEMIKSLTNNNKIRPRVCIQLNSPHIKQIIEYAKNETRNKLLSSLASEIYIN